ncbi:MAG TPA: hypothetical protein VFV81_03685 [Verrucomicrobiae bacterium]|nr:hypothetical protein [Verrucomicrobiae bacterium]
MPLVWMSHMLDFDIYGIDPLGHHLTNVGFHAANTVLLFLVLNLATGARWRSFLVAALFAVHPLRVESVTWISERKDVLSVFFGLLALLAYVHYARTGWRAGYWLACILFAGSLMSKAMLVTFPFLLLLVDYWPLQRFGTVAPRRLVAEKIPFLLLTIPVSVMACLAQQQGDELVLHPSWMLRMETAIIGYVRYLGKMVWPENLAVLYPFQASWPLSTFVFSVALLALVSLGVLILRKERPYLLTGWLWFVGTLVPVIGIVQLGVQSMADRYTYFPMIGILIAVVWGAAEAAKSWRPMSRAAFAVLFLAILLAATHREISYWRTTGALWTRTISVTRNNAYALDCYGKYLLRLDPPSALTNLEAAVQIQADNAEMQRDLATADRLNTNYPEAMVHLQRALTLEPGCADAEFSLGQLLWETGRSNEALTHLLFASKLDPGNRSIQKAVRVARAALSH